MNNSDSSDATGNPGQSRSSSPGNTSRLSGVRTQQRRVTRGKNLNFRDEPEVDRVKRYFVGKELQKVWGRVSETGRQRIIKQYSTIGIIITEAEVEEPLPDEDESMPNLPMEPDYPLSNKEFKFSSIQCYDVSSDSQVLTSFQPDLTELMRDPHLIPNPGGGIIIQLIIETETLSLSHSIEPDWDFYEYCYDDYRTKVRWLYFRQLETSSDSSVQTGTSACSSRLPA